MVSLNPKHGDSQMMKLAVAALLVSAAGAMAQTCEKTCSEETTVTTVAQTQTACCESGKAEAVIQTVAATEPPACQSSCTETGAVVQTASLEGAGECCGDGECCGVSCDEQKTQGAVVSASMPVLMYVVGDKTTACSVEAGQLASTCDGKTKYKVGDSTFEDYMEAGRAYSNELQGYLEGLTRVSFVVDGECCECPYTAAAASAEGKKVQYKVGGVTFDCAEKAVFASAKAYAAARQVKMSYLVNGEATECSESFKAAQACSETKAAYRVAGKSYECDVQASCELMKAKILAASEAIEKSQG
jgi:hypothetical protein